MDNSCQQENNGVDENKTRQDVFSKKNAPDELSWILWLLIVSLHIY